jgi:bifunctional DNA-binding transcriptional regulator/antitoxin component of YhaV-PrlF toxin-antitoxin module
MRAKLFYNGKRKGYEGQPVLYIPKTISDLFMLKRGDEMIIRIQDGKLILKRPRGDEEGYKARVGIIAHSARGNRPFYFGLRLNTQIAKMIESALGNRFDVHLEESNGEVLVVYTPARENTLETKAVT